MAWFEKPAFAIVELSEASQKMRAGFADQGSDEGSGIVGWPDMKRGSGVAKLIKEAGRVVKVSLDEREGSGGAFLSGVSEGGVNEILDGEVGVGGVGDDESIFFRRFRRRGQARDATI